MARLTERERANLPDRAFAYVDASGRRRLPIHDEAHVRNALARFSQVRFETEDERDRARQRLLAAAKRHGIMPVGFLTKQLRAQRSRPALPTGTVTFLLTDIEGSTGLLRELGSAYAMLLRDIRRLLDEQVRAAGGHRVDAYGDEYFAAFETATGALTAAIAIQRNMDSCSWPQDLRVCVRAGLHSGRPDLTDSGYIGLSVHTVARVCAVAHGGQILVTRQTALAAEPSAGVTFASLGSHRLAGLPRDEELLQVMAEGLREEFPPLRLRL